MDNSTLIGFLKTNLPLLLKNNRDFTFEIVAFTEEDDRGIWDIDARKGEIAFDVMVSYLPETDTVLLHPTDDESLVQTFSDKHQLLTRMELLYFHKRFDNFLPQELDEATQNKIILENVVRICRFVEEKFLEGRLKQCNVIWNEIHLMCEFMFEGNIRGIEHNSWFLSLEYFPPLQTFEELYMISCDGMEEDDEGIEKEAQKLQEAIAIINEKLSQLPR
jgi:hypothetical protein